MALFPSAFLFSLLNFGYFCQLFFLWYMPCFINLWFEMLYNLCVLKCVLTSLSFQGFPKVLMVVKKITWKSNYLSRTIFYFTFLSMAFMKSMFCLVFPSQQLSCPPLLSFKMLSLQNFRAGRDLEITYSHFLI